MKISVMQPYFFPYLGYFQLLNAADIFVIYNDVNYINRGWINRNRILVDGKEHLITLQLVKASQSKLINEIRIVGERKNRERIFKTIISAYLRAPQYKAVIPLIEGIIFNGEEKLDRYLAFSLLQMAEYLNIETAFIKSSEIDKNSNLKGQDKILEIAKLLHADEYINPIGGVDLYDKMTFTSAGINLYFIQSKEISYQQFYNNFIPNLSIIDVVMFNPKEKIQEYLMKYALI